MDFKIVTRSLIVLLTVVSALNAQERRVEKVYNKCYFNAMPDKGKQVKELSKTYESLLISNGILKDNSGESYYNLIDRILQDKFVDEKTNYSFIDSINKLTYFKLVHANVDCVDKVKSLKYYKGSNTELLEKRVDSLFRNGGSPEKQIAVLLTTLKNEDFEIDYYKLRVLLLLRYVDPEENVVTSKLKKYSEERIENALPVMLREFDRVFIDGKKYTSLALEKAVKNYIKEEKEKALIQLEFDAKVPFGNRIKFLQILNFMMIKIRSDFAEENYNKTFDELSDEEKYAFNNQFSFDVYEKP